MGALIAFVILLIFTIGTFSLILDSLRTDSYIEEIIQNNDPIYDPNYYELEEETYDDNDDEYNSYLEE